MKIKNSVKHNKKRNIRVTITKNNIGEKLKLKDIKIAILRIEGTNCEQESYDAFKRLGASPEFVHLKQLLNIDCNKDEIRKISQYQCLMIPGGFSAGDYIRV